MVSAITMACASLLAADEIKVEVLDWSGGACLGNFTEFFADEGAPITIPISSCVRRINVYSAPGVAPPFPDIGRITITGTTSNDFEVVISSSALNTSLTSTYSAAGNDWGGLSVQQSGVAEHVKLGGDIRGDLTGSIAIGRIYRFDVDGEVRGDITMTNTTDASTSYFALHCGSIHSSSRVSRPVHNITRVIVAGDCHGEIDAISGNLLEVDIGGDCTGTIEAGGGAAGDIGSLIVGGRLGTPSVQASVGFRNDLGSLVAGEINAKIAGPDGRFWGGTIQTLQTTGANGTSGRLAGNITVVSLVPDGFSAGMIKSAGPFEGRIEVLQGLPPIDPPTSGGFRIETPAGGLQGLIVFNVDNTDPPAEWEGDVKVGTTTLAPGYSASSASLGGGAVGVLPFGLHGTDCEPAPDGGSVAFALAPGPMTPVQLRHYGTIRIEGTNPENAISLEAKLPEGTNWVDQSDCIDAVGVGANATILEITPNVALQNGYTYKITTTRSGSDLVRCDLAVLTTADPVTEEPLVEDYTYEFCVGTALVSDINGDGAVDVIDYGLYVATFGQQGCGLAGDLNADQEVDVLDFAVYLSEFGANELGPCTVETETESLTGWPGGGPLADLLESLGYESIAEYSEWLDSLSHAEQIEELAALFELAQEE